MARKKQADPVAEATTGNSTSTPPLMTPANEGATDAGDVATDEQQSRPVRQTLTSTSAGVRAGEDKRFGRPQAFVDFDDDQRASDQEKAELKQAGFRYRPSDRGYSTLATPETRQARDELAQKFTERRIKEKARQDEGQER